MTKFAVLLTSLVIAASLGFSGCAQEPGDKLPFPSPESSSEQQVAENESGPESSQTPALAAETEEAMAQEPEETPLLMGNIEVRVTDAPPREEVTGILVTVAEDSLQIHKAVAEQEQVGEGEQNQTQQQEQQGEGEWLTLTMLEGVNQFDLLQIRGLEEVLAVGELEAGKYTQIRLSVESVEVKFGDGEYQAAELSGDDLKFVRPFDVVAGESTVLLLDFDAEKSVNTTGQGKVHVKPVVKLTIQQGKEHEVVSVDGTISTVDVDLGTVSVIPEGETEAIVLDVVPATEIMLNDSEATLEELDGLEAGNSVTANYYADNFHATEIVVYTP